ncbi:MAG: EamA family transporter [Rhodospirillaceae bacterium]|nr:EamA family transporter [Rhodospirillaceae bacterium]MBL6930936.1 EamA family transporter [Rhodospirillales bacterium]MBL6941502.1 EamA family transporter [Rhodospirillales bacterium]
MKTERQAYLLLAIVIVLWGANWPIMKVGVEHIPPLWFASSRLLLGALCVFALNAVRGRLSLPDRRDLGVLVSVGFLQLGLGLALIHIALSVVDAGRSAILAYTTPLWVIPLAVFTLGEKIHLAKTIGLILGLAGVAVLFNPGEMDFSDTAGLLGNGYLIIAAMAGAIVMVHVRHHQMFTPPLQMLPWQMLMGGVILMFSALFIDGIPEITFTPSLVAIIAYNGPIASAFCFWAYLSVMRSLPATSTALGSLGVPVAGMVFSALSLGETLSIGKITGLALISSGLVVLIIGDFKRNSRSKIENDENNAFPRLP